MANFTPQEIEQFLQEFFDVVGTRQYIGARYVPLFGRKGESSIAWDNTKPYEPLTIVTYNGDSYTSRTYVPTGIDILNTDYWVLSGAYNAQVEAYRQEVVQLQTDWGEWKSDTEDDLEQWKSDTIEDFEEAIDNIPQILPSSAFSSSKTVKSYIDDMKLSLRRGVMVVLGDSWSDESNDPTNSWLKIVSNKLQMYAYFTNAKAGMGWYYGSTPIPDQVAGALTKVQDGGYTANDVTLVIAFGGVNDYRHGIDYGSVSNGIRQTFNNVRSTFPNAKIQLVVGNTGRWNTMDTLDTDDPNKKTSYNDFGAWLINIHRNTQNNANPVVSLSCFDAPLWLNSYGSGAYNNIWNADNLHPVQTGHNIIAQNMLKLLSGNSTKQIYVYKGTAATPNGQPTITGIPFKFVAVVDGYDVTISFSCEGSSAADLPDTLTWNVDSSTMPRICGGTSNTCYKIPVTAYNFSGNGYPIRGYYNAETNVLTLYTGNSNHTLNSLFGTVSYKLL